MSGIDPERLRWLRENSGIRLDADGRFLYRDEPVAHPGVIRLFRKGLGRSEDGRPILRVGTQWCFITLDDVFFRVRAAHCHPERPDSDDARLNACRLVLDDDTEEPLAFRPGSLGVSAEGVLYARVKDGREWARLLPSAQGAVGAWLVEHGDGFAVRTSAGDLPVEALPNPSQPQQAPPD